MYTPIMIYNDRKPAATAAATLRRQGSSARVVTETLTEPEEDKPVFILQTKFEERAKAFESLEENQELQNKAIHCPQCNSTQVEYPNAPRVSPSMKALTILNDFIDRIFKTEKDNEFHCLHCDRTWKEKG